MLVVSSVLPLESDDGQCSLDVVEPDSSPAVQPPNERGQYSVQPAQAQVIGHAVELELAEAKLLARVAHVAV